MCVITSTHTYTPSPLYCSSVLDGHKCSSMHIQKMPGANAAQTHGARGNRDYTDKKIKKSHRTDMIINDSQLQI